MVYFNLLIIFQLFHFIFSKTFELNQIWTVKSESNILINGATNLNKFVCGINDYGKESQLKFSSVRSKDGFYNVNGFIIVPINNFNCGHRIMTLDFQRTLKSSKFPEMLINFKTATNLPDAKPECIMVGLEIHLAECVKFISIDFEPTRRNHDLLWKGVAQLRFSDFDLEPPSKFGGSIRVKNDLAVEINLNLSRS